MSNFSWIVLLMLVASTAAGSVIDVDNYQALTSDRRAYRIGDPLVVLVVESTSAESTALTGVTKDTGISAAASDGHNDVSVGLSLSGQGEGSGKTIRKGRATTQLSVLIDEVLENGLLRISGNKTLLVNGEKQRITLSGIIRSEDISKDNTVMSDRIAQADIEIHGHGDVSDAQRQSIIYRVFRWLGVL